MMADAHKASGSIAVDSTSELAELLSHAARRLRRGSAMELAPLGLTYGQARLLHIIAMAGQPLRMADIASQLEVVPRSVTTMVDGVEAAGFVARRPDPDDRRSVLVELTAAGRRLQQRLSQARQNSAQVVFGKLAPAERAELLRLLEVLCEHGECHICCGPQFHTGDEGDGAHHAAHHASRRGAR